MEALSKLCADNNFEFKTYYELLHNTRTNLGFTNRKDALKKIESVLSKEFLLYENGDKE